MVKQPFFSVILPTYNRADMLPVATRSIMDQTFSDWELIIVDDGSTDNTAEIINQIHDERIKYFYQKNQERSAARNYGIDKASGEYFCFLDSDDYYKNNRLELLYKAIKESKELIAMFYTGICFQKMNCITERTELKNDFFNKFDFIVKAIIGVPQVCIKSEIIRKHKFDPQFRIGEDMELWLRIVNEFPLIYLPDQLTVVATDHEGRTVNIKKNNHYKHTLKVFRYILKNFNYPFTKDTVKGSLCNIYFGIARYYIYKKRRAYAIFYLIKSSFYTSKRMMLKHRIFLIGKLISTSHEALPEIDKFIE